MTSSSGVHGDSLRVDPGNLPELATAQDEAASSLEEAAAAPPDLSFQVWVTHGLLCGASAQALKAVKTARDGAFSATKTVSTTLASNLREAEAVYESTDQQAAESLSDEAAQ